VSSVPSFLDVNVGGFAVDILQQGFAEKAQRAKTKACNSARSRPPPAQELTIWLIAFYRRIGQF
jgi:hypothetical protein